MSNHEDSDLRIYVIPCVFPLIDGGDYDENGDHVSRSAGNQFPGSHWFPYHCDFIDEGDWFPYRSDFTDPG
jgi:hypothetical protein